jgi:flagellin
MGLRINQNIAAMNSYRNLAVTDGQMAKSLEKLSSGFRINRAADDAAGLSISEHLRAQTGGLKVGVRNAQDGVSVVQTADGALTETHAILQRMRDLAVQASNGGSQDAASQSAADTEFQGLSKELDRISGTTKFGGSTLLDGNYGTGSASVSGVLNADTTNTATVISKDTDASSATYDQDIVTLTGSESLDLTGSTIDGQAFGGTSTWVAPTGTSYNASGYQAALQSSLDTYLTADNDGAGAGVGTVYKAGDVKVSVEDLGNGTWNVKLESQNATHLNVTGGADYGITTVATEATDVPAVAKTSGTFQVGANNSAQEQIQVAIGNMDSKSLGVAADNLKTTGAAANAIDDIDKAIATVSDQRATLGAFQNRFEHTINNLNVALENLTASESRIRDTDMASEMTQFTRSQILSQAGTAMLAQANQAPQGVMQLLRG